jgi:hypothetical protein
MPQGNAILDCSPIAAAGHVITQSYVPISVSQFMDDLAAEELIGSRCDNNNVSYLSQCSLRVCFTEVALNQMLLDNKKEDPNL